MQKEAVRGALEATPGFVSAQDLHQQLSAAGTRIGLATVYRQLGALAANGEADTIPVASGLLYRACEPGSHHHHLICENCGKAVEIDLPSEEWIRAAASEHGYTITRHVMEIFGLCPDCASS
jgi:Fur family ferric uptake transcriptional regulator